jgi:hypothetical protein
LAGIGDFAIVEGPMTIGFRIGNERDDAEIAANHENELALLIHYPNRKRDRPISHFSVTFGSNFKGGPAILSPWAGSVTPSALTKTLIKPGSVI